MPVNDFKAFATGEFANVLSQPEFEALEAVGNGFQSGIARSEELNKVWRQASTIASVVASFMATKSGSDVLDNGDVNTLQATLLKALLNNSTSQLDGRYLKAASNLSELGNAATARGNLGLKGAAVQDVGTVAGTVAAGNDARIVNAVQRGNNLSDLTDKALARNNIELKSGALRDVQTSKDDITAGKLLSNGSALALRTVRAIAGATGNDVSDVNSLPNNSVSFVYSTATNSPGITGSLLDYCGLNGSYNTQIVAAYSNGGKSIKFRTYNGDAAKIWNPWFEFYHTGNKPSAADVGSLSLGGGRITGNIELFNSAPIVQLTETDTGKKYFIVLDGSGFRINEDSTTGNAIIAYSSGSKQLRTVGQFAPGDYTNFDSRYLTADSANYAGFASGNAASPYMRHTASNTVVTLARAVDVYSKAASDGRYISGVRFGASVEYNERGNTERMAGGVMTSFADRGSSNYWIRLRPLQYALNGAWITAAYA
jgi:hypothetical protein